MNTNNSTKQDPRKQLDDIYSQAEQEFAQLLEETKQLANTMKKKHQFQPDE